MGGRGSSSGSGSGSFGGHGSLIGLVSAMQSSVNNSNGAGQGYGGFHDGEGSSSNDYNDNNNPALVKWQNQADETKVERYLAKLGKQQTPATDAEGFGYHQSAFQNMVIDQNLNAPVYAKLNASDFNKYCQQNNLAPFYRGWSGDSSRTRFEEATASHTGAGMYGEGYYFGDKATASKYGYTMTEAALSPKARVVDLNVVQDAIRNSKARGAFKNSGITNSYFGNNMGEAQMALKLGYNVIRTDWSYVVLTRDAVVIKK